MSENTNDGENGILIVLCTFPDLAKARETGTALVESQLAACVNLIPAVESIYRWEGNVETSSEVLAVFKTTPEAWPRFEARLRELHPYEVPEIVALRPELVADAYARWVGKSVWCESQTLNTLTGRMAIHGNAQ